MTRPEQKSLQWQSKAILLIVLPWTAASTLLQTHWWALQVPVVAWTTLGISGLFGLIVWQLKAGTPAAAATGAAITASLMYSTTHYPYTSSWLHGGLPPLLTLFLLTFAATKLGKKKKEGLGTGESKRGRNAAQVSANLGIAALVAMPIAALASDYFIQKSLEAISAFLPMVALAEAAADTISSEIGQVFGGQPRSILTFRKIEPGTDGGVTLIGTAAGAIAALIVMIVGFWAEFGSQRLPGVWVSILLGTSGGVFGMLFDSVLGATAERRGWLNNDAVNFLSTLSAVVFVMAVTAVAVVTMGQSSSPN